MKSECRTDQIIAFALLICLACRPTNTQETHHAIQPSEASRPASSPPGCSFLDTVPDLIFTGDPNGPQQFGNHIYAGDVNGDGCDDLLVAGASRYNNCQGRVYLYYGGPTMDANADRVFTGEATGSYFGEVASLGDVNGNGYADVIIGAFGYNNLHTNIDRDRYVNINGRGRTYLFYGGPDMDENAHLILDGEAGTQEGFGRLIATGDVNGDGYDDLFISAIFHNNSTGRVYLYYGGKDADTACAQTFDGENKGDRFGYNIYAGKDVNGDAVGDVIISAEDYIGGNRVGRAYLYYGSRARPMDAICDKTFTGTKSWERFANEVALADVDRDGFSDVIIGAPFWGTRGGGEGRAYLYWGAPNMDVIPAKTFTGKGDPDKDYLGTSLAWGHLNNDEYLDILIGAYNYYNNDFRGRAFVYEILSNVVDGFFLHST